MIKWRQQERYGGGPEVELGMETAELGKEEAMVDSRDEILLYQQSDVVIVF